MESAPCYSIRFNSVEDLQQILEEYWGNQPSLKNLAHSIAEMAFKLQDLSELDDGISPFVYTL